MSDPQETLPDFLVSLEEFQPTVPDELIQFYARKSGCELREPRLVRMIGVATHKFLTEILQEALQVSRLRDHLSATRLKDLGFNPKDRRRHLLLEDLVKALNEYGISIPHIPFYNSSKDGNSLEL